MSIKIRVFTALPVCLWLAASNPAAAENQTLKVCSAEDEMPYANKNGEGFENKLAQLLGEELGREIDYVNWSDPRYFVRDYLDKGLCDVVIGVDSGDPRALTSEPYYRSGYVFISRAKDKLDLHNWDSAALQKAQRIAFVPSTPAETMLRKIGRYNDMFNYMHELAGFKSRRNQYVKYEASKLVAEVAAGKAEVAVLWGPTAARYVKDSATPLTMSVIPDNNVRADGAKVGFHYSTSVGVRKGETSLLEQLNRAINHRRQDIAQLLKDEGIPLTAEPKAAVAAK
jgi:mxaJ protein